MYNIQSSTTTTITIYTTTTTATTTTTTTTTIETHCELLQRVFPDHMPLLTPNQQRQSSQRYDMI